MTDLCATYADHPVDRLCRAGLSVGINTDGRTLPGVTLTEEYARLRKTFNWSAADLLRRNLDAIAAAFAPNPVKAQVEQRLRVA